MCIRDRQQAYSSPSNRHRTSAIAACSARLRLKGIGVRTSRLGSLLAPDDLRRCTPSPGGLELGRPFHDAIADRHAWVPNRISAPPWWLLEQGRSTLVSRVGSDFLVWV